jgi:hypothetical protein
MRPQVHAQAQVEDRVLQRRTTLRYEEPDYTAPFDFEQSVTKYRLASECVAIARSWFDGLPPLQARTWRSLQREDNSELSGIRLGEHVAENEAAALGEYFVETSAYEAAIQRDALFVGHRGTGKTASASQAFEEVASNPDNLAVLIKPPGFEFPAILALI